MWRSLLLQFQRLLSSWSLKPNELIVLGKKFSSPSEALEYFAAIPWFTYRNHFPEILNSSLTSDTGWGCMLRTGQMLLATALHVHLLTRPFFELVHTSDNWETYIKIMSWFLDHPDAPFSIHNIAIAGTMVDKQIGQWHGPNTVAQVLQKLVNGYSEAGIHVHVATQNVIYESELPKHWKPTLIMIPVRLGIDTIHPIYLPKIKETFSFPQFVGIAGGRPQSSYFFIGIQDDQLIYLDPHYSQDSLPIKPLNAYTYQDFNSYHCTNILCMNILSLDPSMVLGFYCRTYQDYLSFKELSLHKPLETDALLYEFASEKPSYLTDVDILSDFEDD